MNSVIVLAMHGMPPLDYPQADRGELMVLRSKSVSQKGSLNPTEKERLEELDKKMRTWPRTAENDPFHKAAGELAQALSQKTGFKVLVGYNEFCSPSIDEALEEASSLKPGTIHVMTPMMMRGGNHAEHEIPQAIEACQKRHPDISIRYAWPYEPKQIAGFLAGQIEKNA